LLPSTPAKDRRAKFLPPHNRAPLPDPSAPDRHLKVAVRSSCTLWGRNGLTLPYRVYLRSRVNLEKMPMNLTIKLPDEDVAALRAKATAQGITEEQYALQVLEQDLAPEWLRQSWATAKEIGLDQLSADQIDAEIAAARKARREANPHPGA